MTRNAASSLTAAGVDEAGLGPVLGPLVVSGTALRLVDHDAWRQLEGTVSRGLGLQDHKLVVDDSKRVLAFRSGRVSLERTVLACAAIGGEPPSTMAELLDRLAPGSREHAASLPWYGSCDLALPVWATADQVDQAEDVLEKGLQRHDSELLVIGSRLLFADQLNRIVEQGQNKAEAAFTRVQQVMLLLADERGGAMHLRVDRLGGRKFYAEHLSKAFPRAVVSMVEEGRRQSCYRVERHNQVLNVDFAVAADASSFPVALASMVSKYLRELFMVLLNDYWLRKVPGLRPTAGYPVDGRRFIAGLTEAGALSSEQMSLLVRCR